VRKPSAWEYRRNEHQVSNSYRNSAQFNSRGPRNPDCCHLLEALERKPSIPANVYSSGRRTDTLSERACP
jgi:hypothetical protein